MCFMRSSDAVGSGSRAGPAHAEALVCLLLLLFWDPDAVFNSRGKSGKGSVGGGEKEITRLNRETKTANRKGGKSAVLSSWLPAKQEFYSFLGLRFILLSGASSSKSLQRFSV